MTSVVIITIVAIIILALPAGSESEPEVPERDFGIKHPRARQRLEFFQLGKDRWRIDCVRTDNEQRATVLETTGEHAIEWAKWWFVLYEPRVRMQLEVKAKLEDRLG